MPGRVYSNVIRSWGIRGGSLQLVREALVEPSPSWSYIDEENLDLGERNVKHCKRKICDGHYTAAVRVLSSSGVAPYNDATLEDLKAKHPLKHASSFPHIPIDHHQLIASHAIVLDMIKSFPRGTSCGRDGLRAQNLMDCLSGVVVAISDELISYITQVMNLFLDVKCLQMLVEYIISALSRSWSNRGVFGVGVSGGGDVILHAVNQLIEDQGDDVGLSMLLVDFKNAFNLVAHELCYSRSYQGVQQGNPLGPLLFALVLHPLLCKIRDSFNLSLQAWYLDDGTIIGDTLVVGKILELIMKDGPHCSLHLNIDKTEIFWPKEDPRSKLAGWAQYSFDASLHSALERIVTASGLGFGEWQWRLSTLPFAFGGLGVYSDFTMCVMLSLGVPLFPAQKPYSACSRVFARDIYEDRVVLCVAGKEVDIGVGRGQDKPLRPADILLYSWDRGIDVCVDLTGLSRVTQTWMIDFVPGLAKDAVTLLKRIRKFSIAQDIGARTVVYIFSMISFAIAKGVRAKLVSLASQLVYWGTTRRLTPPSRSMCANVQQFSAFQKIEC
ncbi:hypothetical protein Tco_1133177 [Tanacetum coccineum]|uniref:Reverse transcriptase domain-containing protein n=1 Tax=Tanacetum coccineum TaxID=301880 RepID=A0ABQ5JE08_9ASTR